jgi:hypothetical protein
MTIQKKNSPSFIFEVFNFQDSLLKNKVLSRWTINIWILATIMTGLFTQPTIAWLFCKIVYFGSFSSIAWTTFFGSSHLFRLNALKRGPKRSVVYNFKRFIVNVEYNRNLVHFKDIDLIVLTNSRTCNYDMCTR